MNARHVDFTCKLVIQQLTRFGAYHPCAVAMQLYGNQLSNTRKVLHSSSVWHIGNHQAVPHTFHRHCTWTRFQLHRNWPIASDSLCQSSNPKRFAVPFHASPFAVLQKFLNCALPCTSLHWCSSECCSVLGFPREHCGYRDLLTFPGMKTSNALPKMDFKFGTFIYVNFRCFKIPTPKRLESNGCILFCRLAQSMLTTHATHTDGVRLKLCET